MISIVKIIEKVKYFFDFNKEFYYQNTIGELFSENVILNNNVIDFKISNNFIFCQKKELIEVINFTGNCLTQFTGNYFLTKSFNDSSYFYILKEDLDKDSYYKFNAKLEVKEVDWNDNFIKEIFNTFYISIVQNKFSCNELNSGKSIWQQSFSDLLPSQETEEISISQEIIEISNIIYFTLNT
ncbi:hypothetical protein, partial [Flavobacterium oreochromis]